MHTALAESTRSLTLNLYNTFDCFVNAFDVAVAAADVDRPECEGTLRAVFRFVVQTLLQEEMVSDECLTRWVQLRR